MWTLVSVALTVMALKWVLAAPVAGADPGDDSPESEQRRWWGSRLALLMVTPLAITGAASVTGNLVGPLWRLGDWGGDSGPGAWLKQYAPQIALLFITVWLFRWRPPVSPQAGGANPESGDGL